MTPPPLHAFAAYGIELEYMIVDRKSLAVQPISDRLLGDSGDVARGHYAWSNEVALHVIELKNATPDAALAPLAGGFQGEVQAVNAALAEQGACLMPSAKTRSHHRGASSGRTGNSCTGIERSYRE